MEWLFVLLGRLRPQIRFRLNAEFDASFGNDTRPPRLKADPMYRGLEHAADDLSETEKTTKRIKALGRS